MAGEAQSPSTASRVMSCGREVHHNGRLIPKRGKVKAGIVLALAHALVALFSIQHRAQIRSLLCVSQSERERKREGGDIILNVV